MTAKTDRKSFARQIQADLGVSYGLALQVFDTRCPPDGWTVNPTSARVAKARAARARSQSESAPSDPVAHLLVAFADLGILECYARAPRCRKEVEGFDPHTGDWMSVECSRAQHVGPCAPDEVLHFLWYDDMGPASEPLAAARWALRDAWRAMGRTDSLDENLQSLVRVAPSPFEIDEIWADFPDDRGHAADSPQAPSQS